MQMLCTDRKVRVVDPVENPESRSEIKTSFVLSLSSAAATCHPDTSELTGLHNSISSQNMCHKFLFHSPDHNAPN